MGIIKKQAVQSTVFLYVGVVIGFVTTGILAPNFLTKSQIGALNLLASYSGLFTSLGVLGFTTATIRYFPYFRDKDKDHNGFLFLSLLVGAIGFLVFLLIYYPVKPLFIASNADKSPLFAQYFFLIVPLTFFQIFFLLLDNYNTMLYNASLGIVLRDFLQRFLIMLSLLLVVLNFFGFDIYVYLYVAAICIPTVAIVIYLIYQGDFSLKPKFSFIKSGLYKGMISVSAFGFLNSFSNIAILRLDTIMVNHFIDDAAAGVYVTLFFFGTLVLIPARALNKIAPTLVADAYKANDHDTVDDIYKKSCLNLYIIGLLMLVGLAINFENIFKIIPKSYEVGKYVVLLIGATNLVKMAAGLSDSVIAYSKYYKFTTVFLVILLILIVGFNYIFIPLFGISGAAFASFLAILIHALIKYVFIKKTFKFQPYNYRFVVLAVIALAVFGLVSLIPTFPNFIVDIAVRSIAATILYGFAVIVSGFSPDLNHLFFQLVGRLKKLFLRDRN